MPWIYNEFCFDNNKKQILGNTTDKKTNFSVINQNNLNNKITFNKIIYFHNRWDRNFRHFMIETFYLLENFYKPNFDKNGLKIIIGKTNPKFTYQILEILELTKYVLISENDRVYYTDNLIYSNRNVHYNNQEYKLLVEDLIRKSLEKSVLDVPEKIYLSREHCDVYANGFTPKRWITNTNKLNKIMIDNGYVQTRVDNMDFWDQVTTIYKAKKIITFIGANCDNINFCNKNNGTKFLIVGKQSWWLDYYNFHPTFCKFIGTEDNTVIFNPSWGKEDPFNGPFKVDEKKFEIMIKKL
jgi:hypothetical protein